jgi:peptide/nickel transport system permease protein
MRIARGSTIALRQREFVVASRAMGNGGAWTVLRHIVPNCVPPLLVFSTTLFGSAILAESALSFLGLGVQPPSPTWGGMLADSRNAMDRAIWLALFPGLAISLALLGINLFGDGLRDVLDPRMKGVKA